MNPLLIPMIGGIVDTVAKVADDLFTSDEERAKAALEVFEAETKRAELQTEINKVEAGHQSLFVAGWRPAVGWVGVAAMAYQFVVYPFLTWGWTAMQAAGWIATALPPPPILDTDALWVILSGILGIGAYRSFDKWKVGEK